MNQLAETGWQQMHKMLVERGLSTDIPSFGSSKKKNLVFGDCRSEFYLFCKDYYLSFFNTNTRCKNLS